MATLAALQLEYKIALQDLGAQLETITGGTDVRDKAIIQAISYYQRRIPRVVTSLVTAINSGFYPVPADWFEISRAVSIEFPLNQSPPQYVSSKGIVIQRRETGLFYYVAPNPTGSYRFTYTAKHGGGMDTPPVASINVIHEPLVGKWSASIAAEEFATRYANSVSNNLDAVNYRTKEQEWRSVAKSLRDIVDREMRHAEWAQTQQTESDALQKGWRS